MTVRILTGDCRDMLRTMPDESVHCCVTSPPYWGLRDYGTATWEGGNVGCDHIERTAADCHASSTLGPNKNNDSFASAVSLRVDRRNKRSVWEVATAPFSEAHFATFPPALIEPCIKAGTSEKGCCAKCGAPWVREVERVDKGYDGSKYGKRVLDAAGGAKSGGTAKSTLGPGPVGQRQTLGWSPSCSCNAEVVPCAVLDPFAGAGTTGLVADRLQRDAILIELNPQYAAMADRRIHDDAPLFTQMAAE